MELEQLEALALAEDRSAALAQLIPGTEDYYFHHCLELQHRGELDGLEPLLAAWVKRHGETARVRQIRDRQALLGYAGRPGPSLEYLRRRLSLTFDHQREVEGAPSQLPTRIAAEWIGREPFRQDALRHHVDLGGFRDRALDWLATERKLNSTQARSLLRRVQRPDLPGLVALILQELDDPHSSGFGSLEIHKRLTTAQLDELAAARPGLGGDASFVEQRITRMLPGPDVDLRADDEAMDAHLRRLWAFVEPLVDAYNSLKVHVLHHRLSFDRARGRVDRQRLMTYLKLPRRAPYLAKAFRERHERSLASFGDDYESWTGLGAVHEDTQLVTDLLARVFAEPGETSYDAYLPVLDGDFVRRRFAETKILAGLGDAERWYSLLDDPSAYEALERRVDIELCPENPTVWPSGAPVELLVELKQVPRLLVKVFEINTLAYFQLHGREVDTGVDLDGLVAREERVEAVDEPALRRVRRTLRFEDLDRPGTYVIELIGGGKSSRALVRKGALRYVERLDGAGHVLSVLDEDDREVPDASAWFGGREYVANAAGEIRLPYGSGGATKILLSAAGVSSVRSFAHRSERYELLAGFHVEREQLLAGAEASVLVRLRLTVNGVPIPASLLTQLNMSLQSTDRHGTMSSVTVPLEPPGSGSELRYPFKVPEELASLRFELRAKVRNLSEQRDQEFIRSYELGVNGIDRGQAIVGLHLERSAEGYTLHALGKTGEARAGVQVNLRFAHRDFFAWLQIPAQTDARGQIDLGQLDEIEAVSAAIGGQAGDAHWELSRGGLSLPPVLHVAADTQLVLPRGDDEPRAVRSLLARCGQGQGYTSDRSAVVRETPDAIHIETHALEPGDYDLVLEPDRRVVRIRVGGASVAHGWALSPGRHLQLEAPELLRIAAVELDDTDLIIDLADADADARVHVFASRFLAGEDARATLAQADRYAPPSQAKVARSRSRYLSGRDIGDEYRYILDRRRDRVFAGTSLERPGLLLNPWAVRGTSTGTQAARGGASYDSYADDEMAREMAEPAPEPQAGGAPAPSNNLDFLPAPAFVAHNLRPDADGRVRIARADLAGRGQVTIVAANAFAVVSRTFALPSTPLVAKDLRLADGLDPAEHFVKQRAWVGLAAGEAVSLDDPRTAKLEAVDSVAKAHALLSTLSQDATLRTFEFVTRWPRLDPDEQRELYSKHACHELSLFLARKDPAFFASVVAPYLAHKRDKTFLDRYLLGEELGAYLEPWAYGRLNTLERLLLAGRVPGEGEAGARHVRDRFELLEPDVEGEHAAFDTALRGSALALGGAIGSALAQFEESEAVAVGFGGAAGGGGFGSGGPPPMPRPAAAPARAAAMPPPPPGAPAPSAPRSRAAAKKRKQATRSSKIGEAREELSARAEVQGLYRPADTTKEWAENNYYQRTIAQMGPELVGVNAFWRDYAAHLADVARGEDRPFLSGNFIRATANFTQMMAALALLDLPFEAGEPALERVGASLRMSAPRPMVAYHEQIAALRPSERQLGILVSQNYLRADDRYRYEGGERHDKYVDGELLVNTVYECEIVLTNPSSAPHKLDLLVQIPRGALAVANGFVTQSLHVHLAPRGTQSLSYSFYFPAAGRFEHYPVHVAKRDELVAFASARILEVVERLRSVDERSWSHVSQHGSTPELLAYLDANNLERVELGRIAWRMRDRAVFEAVLAKLRARHVYANSLWSYAIHHGDAEAIGEYLRHQDGFLSGCGLELDSPLVGTSPVARGWYQHLEYAPLINARAHRLGARRKILNAAFATQYHGFLTALCYAPRVEADALVSATYYMLLQDRVAEALALLARVEAQIETETVSITGQLQLDYLRAYVALLEAEPGSLAAARTIAQRWIAHPVDRWRKRFTALVAVLDEAEGSAAQLVDLDSREQAQDKLASQAPGLELEVEGATLRLNYRNLGRCTLSLYRMDIELLFSRQPFMKDESGRFAIVSPNYQVELELEGGGGGGDDSGGDSEGVRVVELPPDYRSQNAIIEVRGGGIRRSQANYAHDLAVQMIEPLAQVRVLTAAGRRPLARAYVKVYARERSGAIGFYKDGYTDVRGAFDYASLSTSALDQVERFAVLVMTADHGALIREAAPPQR